MNIALTHNYYQKSGGEDNTFLRQSALLDDGRRDAEAGAVSTDRANLGQPRKLRNIFYADRVGCHIITASHDTLKKLALVGKDLDEYSLDTVKMFHNDAVKAGFTL